MMAGNCEYTDTDRKFERKVNTNNSLNVVQRTRRQSNQGVRIESNTKKIYYD